MASETAFKSMVSELGLDDIYADMKENGWVTFGDFAFATGDPTGKDAEVFKKEVLDILLKPEQKALIPRLRRLYAQAYIVASQQMNDLSPGGSTDQAGDRQRVLAPAFPSSIKECNGFV